MIPEKIRGLLENFTSEIKDVYNDGLVSVALYGSAASNEFSDKYSNINLAVVLNDTTLENLTKMSTLMDKRRYRLFNLMFFTEDYIARSRDVFPIEFLDLKENHIALYGKDVFKDLKVDISNLRFQCEHELKAKLINIKRLYLKNRSKQALSDLLFRSFTSVLHILRNLVRLKGVTPSYRKEDLVKDIAREFQIDTSILEKILRAKIKGERLGYKEAESLFFSFVKEIERIADAVDQL